MMREKSIRELASIALAVPLAVALLAGVVLAQQPAERGYRFRVSTELVLVNVAVRDKKGNLVRDLKREDFTLLEDNKPQQILTFDLENTDTVLTPASPSASVLDAAPPRAATTAPASSPVPAPGDLKDRRLIILFFDLSAMQPEEIQRAVTAAQNYVDRQMAAADLVAVVSLCSSLRVNQDFTSECDLLKKAIQALSTVSGQGFEEGSTGDTEGSPDTGQPFTPDETEYNIFNTDRRLEALRSLALRLAQVEQKKSLIYFSSGMNRTGVENQAALRAAINAAVRSNLAIYTLDLRGLQALVPGGEAQRASLRGTAPYSGRSVLNQYDSNFSTQETLVTLAGDTGGRAFLESNDFDGVFRRVQADTSTYYLLGYHSTNPARDGRFRRITVRVNRSDVKLEFRRGYYAPADFQHASREDRERQLEGELASDLSSTDLPVYLAAGYFRLSENRFFVPVSVVVPGSMIPFTRASDQDRATLDVLGVAFDDSRRPAARIRDTVKLAVSGSQEVRRKNVQYDSSFVLPAGTYHLKFVVRENQSGRLGSFETDLVIPELEKLPLKLSSVVLASQTRAAARRKSENPLARDGVELIPNVTHVFSSGQHLYLYYEVYDPGRDSRSAGKPPAGEKRKSGIRVLSSVSFFQGKTKAYETPPIEVEELGVPERRGAVFQLDIPLAKLKPGFYTCQVNVIDDAAARFLFPRFSVLIR